MSRNKFISLIVMMLLALLVVFLLDAYADSETIRPTGAFDASSRWQNEANTYDNDAGTYSDINSVQDGLLYVGASGAVGTDAWNAPSASYTAATLYCTYSSDGWSGNDTFAVEVRNGADTVVTTLEAATGNSIAKTTKTYTLTGGYLSDPTDLRCVGNFNRTGGADSGNSYVYEVWIVGNYTASTRTRMLMMGKVQ
jgi:hypothetical protein